MSRGKEKATLLGARVYKKHRKMLAFLKKTFKMKDAETLRRAIEETHERYARRIS